MIAPTSLKHQEGGAGGTAVQITSPRVDIARGWTHKRVGTEKHTDTLSTEAGTHSQTTSSLIKKVKDNLEVE